jgi:hypothetical protein
MVEPSSQVVSIHPPAREEQRREALFKFFVKEGLERDKQRRSPNIGTASSYAPVVAGFQLLK